MCTDEIGVHDLPDQRSAYEVQSYLQGLQCVHDAEVDFLADEITVTYDESLTSHDEMLTEIERAGCTPNERINGLVDRIKARWVGQKV